MKVAVYGAGAVGGLLAIRLATSGCQVSVIARGRTLASLRTHGLRLQQQDGIASMPVSASDNPEAFGVQDIVFLAVKATAMHDIANRLQPLIGSDTMVVTAMNGVPWWFFDVGDLPYAGTHLPSLDPTGMLSRAIPIKHIVGCVVHLSSSCPEPGLVRPGFGNRLIIGKPDGSMPHSINALEGLLRQAGFDAQTSADIRADVWYKLWGNMTINPVSVITGATCDKILEDPLVTDFCLAAMHEAAEIGKKIGCPIGQSGKARLDIARTLGAFKTSMLQDAGAGKPLEIDSLVTSVHEIGRLTGVPTPTIDSLLGLIRLYGRVHRIYPMQS